MFRDRLRRIAVRGLEAEREAEFLMWDDDLEAERRDFAAADAIRDRLASAGIRVEDRPGGPRWHLAP